MITEYKILPKFSTIKTWKLTFCWLFQSFSNEFIKTQLWFHIISWYKKETPFVCQSTFSATSIRFWQVSWRHCLIIERLLIVWIHRLISLSWHNYHWKTTKKIINWNNEPAIRYQAVLSLENFQFLFNKTVFHFGIFGYLKVCQNFFLFLAIRN